MLLRRFCGGTNICHNTRRGAVFHLLRLLRSITDPRHKWIALLMWQCRRLLGKRLILNVVMLWPNLLLLMKQLALLLLMLNVMRLMLVILC